jgi:hypothetical protein
MFNYFKGLLASFDIKFPYYSRAMVPFFASLVPIQDPIKAFAFINLVFTIMGVGIIYQLWRKLNIPLYLILIGLFWLLFHWTGLIRLNIADPITVDVPTYFIQGLFILIVLYNRYYWLLLIGPLTILQRESILVLLLLLLIFAFFHNYYWKERKPIPMLPVILAIALSILTKYFYTLEYPPVDEAKSSVRLVLFYIREVVFDPFKIIRWIIAILVAYGMFLVIALTKIKKNFFADPFFNFLTLQSFCYLLLGIIAGGDSTRIVFLGFPFIMTWIFLVLKDQSWMMLSIALLLSLHVMRLLETIPDPGVNFNQFKEWYPEFAPPAIIGGWAIYFTCCSLLFFVINKIIVAKGKV